MSLTKLAWEDIRKLYLNLKDGWKVIDEHHLEKDFAFKDFKETLVFTNKIGALAEQLQHHPDLHLSWGNVKIIIWTHKVDGLTENDFYLAQKIDEVNP